MVIRGIVTRLIEEKGFGFLVSPDSDREFFFHRSSVQGVRFEELHEGLSVEFIEGDDIKGPRAEQVRLVE